VTPFSIPDFSSARVLVAGDVMLDRYWSGGTERISPEAPVPVVHVGERHDRLGGAGNVAANLVALGATVGLLGVIGNDEAGAAVRENLNERGISDHLLTTDDAPTIVKLRITSRNQQLIRLDFEQQTYCADLADRYAKLLTDYDLVILSDYAKGSLRDIAALVQAARAQDKLVVIDPKGSDYSRYTGATVITPNRSEFELAANTADHSDETLLERVAAMRSELQLNALLLTRSEEGMSLFQPDAEPVHLPTEAREVFDVTGAGDTVAATLAAALAAGQSMESAARLANLAAGIVVGKIGAAQVTPTELRRAAHQRFGSPNGMVPRAQLAEIIAAAKAAGERIVFTNGCFDLLHPGHVAYLEQAKQLGDRLIVAVNDDASVSRLKGDSRPINPVAQRMAVLAGLASVDWVTEFSEDTPAELIAAVNPEVLVKGGDYKAEEIAGYDSVSANGGQVCILDFLEGYSTSAMVKRITS